jgi:D-alanyl-D-alanine carboxypeptidase (penicillin-binding protein 5/6)
VRLRVTSLGAVLAVLTGLLAALPAQSAGARAVAVRAVGAVAAGSAAAGSVWPAHGQAAYVLGGGELRASPHARAVPIASVAKVMTAYLVLRRYPLTGSAAGFTMTVHARDVADWRRRVERGESTVPVRAGERLTERQALLALLLPSANNVAIMLARKVSGTVRAFARRMNRTAVRLGMKRSTYTDPSGFDARTRSVPVDQVRLALAAMRDPFFRWAVSRRSAVLPVAGRVHNYDTLLGTDGFVGIKTGSMDASGGCFLFRSHRLVGGRRVNITGVVLGQPGRDLVAAGLLAARRLVDRVAPRAA